MYEQEIEESRLSKLDRKQYAQVRSLKEAAGVLRKQAEQRKTAAASTRAMMQGCVDMNVRPVMDRHAIFESAKARAMVALAESIEQVAWSFVTEAEDIAAMEGGAA